MNSSAAPCIALSALVAACARHWLPVILLPLCLATPFEAHKAMKPPIAGGHLATRLGGFLPWNCKDALAAKAA